MAMAVEMRPWSLEELDRLPDDGNRYELVRGELFVTPAPGVSHETVLVRLSHRLVPYVAEHRLGQVHRRSVVRFEDSSVEPDLAVRRVPNPDAQWKDVPTPILVVEVLSRVTRQRDRNQKRQFYVDAGVADYWIVDREQRTVTVVQPGAADRSVADGLEWHPAGAAAPFRLDLSEVFAAT